MEKTELQTWGKRMIVLGVALLPVDVALVGAFIYFARDIVGTFSLTMSLLALSAVLIGFGSAAVSSSK